MKKEYIGENIRRNRLAIEKSKKELGEKSGILLIQILR